MKHIKSFEVFESETGSYSPPEYVIKPQEGDEGFALAKKNYHRMYWSKKPSKSKK